MSLSELLQKRVETLRKEWEAAHEKAAKAKAHEDSIRQKLIAFQKALEAETKVTIKDAEKPSEFNINRFVAPEKPTGEKRGKTAFIRELIQTHANEGIAPTEIWHEFKRANIALHRNYIYAVLAREKERGAVTEKGGRYFPAELKEADKKSA